jgi:hypothetical protein
MYTFNNSDLNPDYTNEVKRELKKRIKTVKHLKPLKKFTTYTQSEMKLHTEH